MLARTESGRARTPASRILGAFFAALLVCSTLTCLPSNQARAADAYPDKPVSLYVGMDAGSFTDLSARWMADELQRLLGSPFVVQNRPGAATNIATGVVARAPHDGYTLLLATNSNTMNPSIFKHLPFDIKKDFTPIAMIATSPFLFVVTASLPISTLKDFIAYAQKRPGQVNIGATGKGTATDLAVSMFAQQSGIKVQKVYYKGSVEAVTDVIAGRIQATLSPISTAMPQIKAGALRALAITSAARTSLAPDVPTMAEAGVPGYEATMWTGLFAPAGTPPKVVDQLSAAATKALATPELQAKIKNGGGIPMIMGASDFRVFVDKDIDRWRTVVNAAQAHGAQ